MDDLISRQQAIDAILHITNCKSVRELFEYNQAHHLTEMWSGGVNDAIDAVIGVESATDKKVGTTDTINRQQAIDAVTDELDTIDHVPQWVFDRLEGRLKQLPPAQLGTNLAEVGTDCISRQAIDKFIDGLEEIFADLRERHVDDSVCGLCEYDGAYIGQSGDWCNECPGFDKDDCFKLSDKTRKEWTEEIIKALPPAQPKQRKEILYKHYKGGTYELVCNNVTNTETGESLVVYRDCRGELWARPELMFYGLVKDGDYLVPRFMLCRSEGDVE